MAELQNIATSTQLFPPIYEYPPETRVHHPLPTQWIRPPPAAAPRGRRRSSGCAWLRSSWWRATLKGASSSPRRPWPPIPTPRAPTTSTPPPPPSWQPSGAASPTVSLIPTASLISTPQIPRHADRMPSTRTTAASLSSSIAPTPTAPARWPSPKPPASSRMPGLSSLIPLLNPPSTRT